MEFHFLGGAMEVGGSCIYIRIADKGILMDSGIRQSGAKDPFPDFRTIQQQGGVDAILISHAHMDHIGTLPIISRAYPLARIYMTAMTADLTRVLLYDSLKIMKNREDEIPHYSETDVRAMLGRIYPVGFQIPFPIFDDFILTFYPAGHIAGAACIYLVTKEGSLFYSSDFSSFSQRTIEGIRIPKLRPDIAIVEATYGNRLHSNRQVEEMRLTELVKECIQQRQKILIPAFALGRAQEVLLILRSAIQNQDIPPVPVYVDGMVRDINNMYTRNPTFLKNTLGKRILRGMEPFYTKEIQAVAPTQKREELLSGSDPLILLSSSGMLTGGPSALYARELAPSEDACIIITGYQDEESPGQKLLNLMEKPENAALTINGSTVSVKCRIEQVGLSAHGDKSEITALLERLSARHIFLVHGNQESIQELGGELAASDYRRRLYLPECGQSYDISLHTKRQQLSFQLKYTLQMDRPFVQKDEKLLWDYWQEHYPNKSFSLSQIAFIWYGRTFPPTRSEDTGQSSEKGGENSELQNMQNILLSSSFFSLNPRRLFLFEANTPEEIAQALTPKELTQQELAARIGEMFSDFPYRKINFHNDRKEILLQFDYPDSQNTDKFTEKTAAFAAEYGWNVQINPSMNHNAALLLLASLFGERLGKTSYYPERKCYTITLLPEEAEKTQKAVTEFQTLTGWRLEINGQSWPDNAQAGVSHKSADTDNRLDDFFLPTSTNMEPLEQNLAFYCIDQTFDSLPHKPEKKSLKQDHRGKYLEISFISPMLGRRYTSQLQELSDQTGWRIYIADKVNQIELFRTAQLLCQKYNICLAKNPSYLPDRKALQLKVPGAPNPDVLEKFTDEFVERTGCECSFQ